MNTEAQRLAVEGLDRAVKKADSDHPDWSTRCWALFLRWIGKKPVGFKFQVENFRQDLYKYNMIEKPQSDRAYGFISRRAVSQGLVVSTGKAKTSSTTAHSANAEVWMKI